MTEAPGDGADEVARLRAALASAEARLGDLHADNQRLRWRHPTVVPEWNDLPDRTRARLVELGRAWSDDVWGGDMAVAFWSEFRAAAMRGPEAAR